MLLPFGGDALARGKFMKIAVKACEQEAVPADADLTFASMDEFTAALPDRSYGLLCLMAQHEPETIAALAKLTGKTAYNTYPLVRQFSELGLVQTEQDAQSKKPELAYDGIVLELVLT